MDKKIRFGFIGSGQIAGYSVGLIRAHPQGEVVAVQDIRLERAREMAAKTNVSRVHETVEALLADPEVDAVYIAVPNKFHAPMAIQALEAGKDVLLEKPFALNVREAEQVAETVRRTGRSFMLGMNFRFSRGGQQLRALHQKGFFGEVYHAKACWQRRQGIPSLGTWFGNKDLAGGGCLFDIGVHFLDLCLYILDNFEPVSVSGNTYTKFGNRGLGGGNWGKSEVNGLPFDVDDFATGHIRMANGSSVHLQSAWACHDELDTRLGVQLFGTEAGGRTEPAAIFYPGKNGTYVIEENLREEPAFPHGCRFQNFINYLLGREPMCVTLEQALTVHRILEALMQSSETGREVRLD